MSDEHIGRPDNWPFVFMATVAIMLTTPIIMGLDALGDSDDHARCLTLSWGGLMGWGRGLPVATTWGSAPGLGEGQAVARTIGLS